jgi:hypothetical protein
MASALYNNTIPVADVDSNVVIEPRIDRNIFFIRILVSGRT